MNDKKQIENISQSSVEDRSDKRSPPLYQVYLLNDDYTPMDFVVNTLQNFFALSEEAATSMMMKVHTTGQCVCGIFTRDLAETKVHMVNQHSRMNQYPLLCRMEKN